MPLDDQGVVIDRVSHDSPCPFGIYQFLTTAEMIEKIGVPQIEDGYLKIANDIVKALAKTHLSSYQNRVLWVIFIKTYGFKKKEDWISNSQFVLETGIRPSHISRAVRELVMMNIVTKRGNKVSFQKDARLWRELPNGVRRHDVTNRGNTVTNRGISELPNGGYTKDTLTKDTLQNILPVVPHRIYGTLESVDDTAIYEISDKYHVSADFVRSCLDDLVTYCGAHGKKYKDYRLALINFVKSDQRKSLSVAPNTYGKLTIIPPSV